MTAPVAEIKACIDSTLHSTASCAKVIKLWGMPEMPAEKRQREYFILVFPSTTLNPHFPLSPHL